MKIICPHHNGLAGIKEDDLLDAFRNPLQTTELNCPICNGQLFINNVCMENNGLSYGAINLHGTKTEKNHYTNHRI